MNIESVKNQNMILDRNMMKNNEIKTQEGKFGEVLKANKPGEVATEKENKLLEMVDNIEQIKELLEHDLTVENLKKYKEAIRSFLDYYSKNELKKETFFVHDSRTHINKKVSIISSLNEKVNNLTENMLETNRGHLETLHQIGEIQGLVVNLFL